MSAGADAWNNDAHQDLARQPGQWTPGRDGHVARLEEGFLRAALPYSLRHGMTYEGWIQAGIAPDVLERAGISPPT